MTWIRIHESKFFTQEGHEMLSKLISVDDLDEIRRFPKHEFLQVVRIARDRLTQASIKLP